MSILDDPDRYYGSPQGDWSLGDVVIVPGAVLWRSGERPRNAYPQPAPRPDGSTSVVYDLWSGLEQLPDPAVECWLGPAVIVVDDCVLDKEFNAFVEQRIREGISEDQAEGEGRADESLDRLVPVAPVLPYTHLRFASETAIRQGQAIGYFPLIASHDVDEGYIDFTRTLPVSRQLLTGPFAAMSGEARRILRWKLAQFYAFRNQSVDDEITAAIGKTITGVHVVKDSKNRLVVDLELDNATSSLRLRQEPRRTEPAPGHQRGR